ncbi:hypothetical protein L1887_34564 [Cichorium endivia]|nr:hypothetical protein L1887_34564 [Cichorium endivia]
MAAHTTQWVRIAILVLLGSTLAMAWEVKPPKADLKYLVKPPKADLDHVVKPPKADVDHVVKPPKPDLDHVVKPPKSDLDHVVKPPKASRKLEMDESGEDESSEMETSLDWEEGGGEGGGIYGGGHGSGGTTFGFHNIHPFPSLPFGAVVPEVSTWGEGGGYGGSNSNDNSGRGVECHCSNGYMMHYTMSPIKNFQPMDTVKRDGPDDMAPSSSP